jgi:hypothetical protein
VPVALRHYRDAEARFDTLGVPTAELSLDRARLLATVGLFRQARTVAERALRRLPAREAPVAHAEALLVAAEAALLGGDPASALRHADGAVGVLRGQGRPGRLALARLLQLRARWAAGDREPALRLAARRTAAQLARAGLHTATAEAHMLAGRVALHHDDRAAGRTELATVAAGRRRGPAGDRSRAWLAEALLRDAAADQRGAVRATRAGLRALERHQAGLGALELRTRTAVLAQELAGLGRRLALESGRADQVLRWTEYSRASALRLPAIRPPADPELAADLAELRRLSLAADTDPTAAGLRERERMQRRIEQRTRERPGDPTGAVAAPPSLARLAAALRDRCLVSLLSVGGDLHAVTVSGGRARLHRLGPVPLVERELLFARSALRRAVQPGRGADLQASAQEGLELAGRRLDALLLAPLRPVADAAELIISPPARLGTVPWAMLPTVRERASTVVPSAAAWYHAAGRPAGSGPVVLVAGPGLAHADAEIGDLAGQHPRATVLTGPAATAGAVCAALDGAALAHLAAHGDVDPENPLFSALRLADGPLMAYDLEQLRRPPATVVLSACDSLNGTVSGDDLLSMAIVLLHLGSRAVIGSVAPLPDRPARQLMRELHGELAGSRSPAAALHQVQRRAFGAGPELAAAASCLLSVGAG